MKGARELAGGASSGARRQAVYAERQRAMGRKQRSYWLNDDEAAQVAALIETLRLPPLER